MAQTGKKINELTAITTVSNETVLPAVYVSGGNASSTANKVSIEQISNKITEDISTVLEGKQDKLTAGDNITIENNVISAEVPSLPENVYTEENLVAGDGITLTKENNITTITATAQVPDNVWTQDNLKAGNNVTITQVEKPVIDENTLGVWHFENNFDNAVSSSSITLNPLITYNFSSGNYKFGNYGTLLVPATDNYLFSDTTIPGNLTLDFWAQQFSTTAMERIYFNVAGFTVYIGQDTVKWKGNTYSMQIVNGDWYHIAIEIQDSTLRFYVNGELKYTETEFTYTHTIKYGHVASNYNHNVYIDELRLSNIARYQGNNFTPYTEPYAPAGGPTEYQINAIVPQGGSAPTLTWYTGNTGTTVTIADTTSASLVKVYKNGILLEPTEDYSISGTTLTLVYALESQDKITTEVFA